MVVNKKTGLEVNADNTKHMVMFRDKNATQSHTINIDKLFGGRKNLRHNAHVDVFASV